MGEVQRKSERVRTTVPVSIDGKRLGLTRDVSPQGIFFESTAEMRQGDEVHLSLEFDTPTAKLDFHCEGVIVRVESKDGKRGVAVKIIDSRLEARRPKTTELKRRTAAKT